MIERRNQSTVLLVEIPKLSPVETETTEFGEMWLIITQKTLEEDYFMLAVQADFVWLDRIKLIRDDLNATSSKIRLKLIFFGTRKR